MTWAVRHEAVAGLGRGSAAAFCLRGDRHSDHSCHGLGVCVMSINYDIDKVTPRPWNVFQKPGPSTDDLLFKPGQPLLAPLYGSPGDAPENLYIARFLRLDDARHAHHCVNHHEELVALLDSFARACSNPTEWDGGVLQKMSDFEGRRIWYGHVRPLRKQARALLAKVKS